LVKLLEGDREAEIRIRKMRSSTPEIRTDARAGCEISNDLTIGLKSPCPVTWEF
jgi:hypothetical protein